MSTKHNDVFAESYKDMTGYDFDFSTSEIEGDREVEDERD